MTSVQSEYNKQNTDYFLKHLSVVYILFKVVALQIHKLPSESPPNEPCSFGASPSRQIGFLQQEKRPWLPSHGHLCFTCLHAGTRIDNELKDPQGKALYFNGHFQ